jgi:hypothetical protein
MLAEAVSIGDELLRRATLAPGSIPWSVVYPPDGRGLTWRQPENLYSGVSGIALFLTELYHHTQNGSYREAALRAMRWVTGHCRQTPAEGYGFCAGRLGASYVLLKLHAATHDPALLEEALDLARPAVDSFLPNRHTTNSLFEGRAGALLVLLHLYQASGQPWLLAHVTAFVDKLLDEARYDEVGIYWDRSRNSTKGLCSFAHGTAGIGYVFSELGRCFNNDAFHAVARQAFAYVNHHWSEEAQNWPDYRKDITGLDGQRFYERAYLNGDLEAFAGTFTDTSWAHGAAGIGLSRVEPAGLPDYEACLADVGRAARTAAGRHPLLAAGTPSPGPQSLYAGLAGEGVCWLEAYRATGHPPYLAYAQAAAEHLQAQAGDAGDATTDFGLLSGRAGLGYFYLQLASPAAGDSVLRPRLRHGSNPPATGPDGFSGPEVRKKLVAGSFPRTVQLLGRVVPGALSHYFGEEPVGPSGAADFLGSARQWIAQMTDPDQEVLQHVLGLETARFEITCRLNNAYLNMRERFAEDEINRLLDLEEEALYRMPFKMSGEAVVVRARQDEQLLRNAGARLTEDNLADMLGLYGSQAVLVMPSSHYHAQEYYFNVDILVLDKLTRPMPLAQACEELMDFFLPNTALFVEKMAYFCLLEAGDKLPVQFRQLLRLIMKKCIEVGILVPAQAPRPAGA